MKLFSILEHFLATNHEDLDKILIFPNVLQLAGALLTLWLGLGSIISKMNGARERFWNTVSDKIMPQHNNELTEPLKNQKDIRIFAKEKNYLFIGIILIIAGYIAGTIPFDFRQFNYYFIALIIALLIGIFISIVKLFKVKGNILKVILICLTLALSFITYLSLFHFPSFPDELKITLVFSGSTALIMFITIFMIEIMLVLEESNFIKKPLKDWSKNIKNNLERDSEKIFNSYKEVSTAYGNTMDNILDDVTDSRIKLIENELKLPIEKYLSDKNLDSEKAQIIVIPEGNKNRVKVQVNTEEKKLEMLFAYNQDIDWELLGVFEIE
jgi:hypothetical protein